MDFTEITSSQKLVTFRLEENEMHLNRFFKWFFNLFFEDFRRPTYKYCLNKFHTKYKEDELAKDAFSDGLHYKGPSYIETNENKMAVENFKWVIDSAQNQQLKIKAKWYLALVYLKENNTEKALPLLSSISKNTYEVQYHKQANEILETLKGSGKNKQ